MSKVLHLADMIGNKNICTQIMVAHGAARLNNRAMRHQLYSGIAGGGKTTTARAVAALTNAPFFEVNAEAVRSPEDLAKLFNQFPAEGYDFVTGQKVGKINPPIVFIDEIHRLTLKSQEFLGIAMENFRHTYSEGRGRRKRTVTTWVPEFTLLGATTREGDLSKPFRDRFKTIMIFSHYDFEESKKIVELHARRRGVEITEGALQDIAARGRGTPRLLVRYLDAVHDLMIYHGRELIDEEITDAQFKLQKIDKLGLTEPDIIILKELYESETGCGLAGLAVKTNLQPKTIEEVNEPYLIRLGMIERTRSGRVITDKGVDHLVSSGLIKKAEQPGGSSRVIEIK